MASKDDCEDDWPDTFDDDLRCERCDGSGEIVSGWEYPDYSDCPSCRGTGRIRDLLDDADDAYERKRDG
tara:strand:+ start:1219 stop:1425 length:207 start_codon:yes stop_codon:yes gene_type:complete